MTEHESARWLWERLSRLVPGAYAAALLPNHLHLGAPPRVSYDEMRRLLTAHARTFGCRWDLEEPTPARTVQIARRTVRYIVHNCVRHGFVADPLAWPWSTARDLAGCVEPQWVQLDAVAKLLRLPPLDALRELLTTDAERARAELAAVDGRPAVVPDRSPELPWDRPIVTLGEVANATASALRTRPSAITLRTPPARAVFVALAERHGAPRTRDLATACEVGPRTIRALRGRAPSHALAAAQRCLLDPRLRRWHV